MKVVKNSNTERQLQNEIIDRCREKLLLQKNRRNTVKDKKEWQKIAKTYKKFIKESFHESISDNKNPLKQRVINREEFENFNIENVLFESMEGWEVNATVYLPKGNGPFPGVICPTGHSSKTRENYQRSAQVFAMNGYMVVSFDPPGVVGELAYMNEHFTNGLIGYLTGIWSNSHFVIDALSAIDYLYTREDFDKNLGITMTGVSGGGATSIYASLLDDRIKLLAPVCCLAEHESIHLTDLYTSCPEQFGPGYIGKGIDYIDLIAIQAPKPCFIVAGKQDEVFDFNSTMRLYDDLKRVYEVNDASENINIYIQEDSGHAYTVKMANKVVSYMNKIIKGQDYIRKVGDEEIQYLSKEKLMCHPNNKVNMFSVNKKEAIDLKERRSIPKTNTKKYLEKTAIALLGLEDINLNPIEIIEEENAPIRWAHMLQKVDLKVASNSHVPGLLYKRAKSAMKDINREKRPAMLFIDENGKWNGFKQQGFLAQAGRFLDRVDEELEPLIFSIDVSGFGELEAEATAFDLASWNGIERILTYLSISSGRSIMGLRVRDGINALNYLLNRDDVDNDKITIAGKGIGAIVALHVALLTNKFNKLILWDMLINYSSMTELFPFTWPQSVVIPNILKYYDLEDILMAIDCNEKIVINPKNAKRENIDMAKATKIYNSDVVIVTDNPETVFINSVLEKKE